MSLMSSVVAGLSQWAGGVKALNWPRPLPVKQFPIHTTTTNFFFPDILAADGSGWLVTGTGTTLSRYGPTGTLIYTLAPSEINALATSFIGVCPDYATGRLYVACDNGSTTLYFGFTTLATKAITQRGTGVTTTLANRFSFMDKVGSDFALIASNANNTAPVTESAIITESTGAISAATAFRLGGVSVVAGNGSLLNGSFYVSRDRSMVMDIGMNSNTVATHLSMRVQRGGGFGSLPLSATNYGAVLPAVVSNTRVGAIANGDSVVSLVMTADAFGVSTLPRNYSRTDFDAFLNRVADNMGLPT